MKRATAILLLMTTAIVLSSCEAEYDEDSSEAPSVPAAVGGCTTTDQTDVRGMENDQWTQLDYSGNYQSQIHLQTVLNPYPFNSVQWNIGENRQTCSGGTVVQSSAESYLQISISPTLFAMQVVPGWNYIDYEAYGCTAFDCNTQIESGTIVLYVNYLQ